MDDADRAYAKAAELIARAKASGVTEVSFRDESFRALDRVPPEIADLAGLTSLSLSGTGVTDLSPVAGLGGLTWLDLSGTGVTDLSHVAGLGGLTSLNLSGTGVTDLRPLRGLEGLAEGPSVLGLHFANIPTTRADVRLAGIAEIKDNRERARALFDFLDALPPPPSPEPDPFLAVEDIDGRLEVAASLPTEAEREERLKQVLHARLREKAADLAREAGNRFPRLARRARVVAGLVDRPLAEVDLLAVHLEVDDLAQRAATGAEDGEAFPAEVAEALGDVLRTGPGLTLGHPDVEVLMERSRRMRDAPPAAKVQAAQDALSLVVAGDEAAIGDNLRAMEARIMAGVDSSVRAAVQGAVHRNLIWKIAAVAVVGVYGVGQSLVAGVVQPHLGAVLEFAAANWAVLTEVAASYGGGFLSWFHAVMLQVPDLRHLLRRRSDP